MSNQRNNGAPGPKPSRAGAAGADPAKAPTGQGAPTDQPGAAAADTSTTTVTGQGTDGAGAGDRAVVASQPQQHRADRPDGEDEAQGTGDPWAATRIVVPSLEEVMASGYSRRAAIDIVVDQVQRALSYRDTLVPPTPAAAPTKAPRGPQPIDPTTHKGRWRVTATKQVSLYGQITTIQAGDVLDPRSYTDDGILRLRDQGLAMEPIANSAAV